MINLTPSDLGKLARLSNGTIVGPLKQHTYSDGSFSWYLSYSNFCWNNDGSPQSTNHAGIIEVLDMPTKKLTITKDDVGRWVKLRNGWIVGPIHDVTDGKMSLSEFGSFTLDGLWCHGQHHHLDIIAIIDPPDQEDHA